MNQTASKAIFISAKELLILLCKREIKGVVLPELITDISANETELKVAMGELITDRYLVPGGDGLYKISDEISEMLDVISASSHAYVITEVEGRFSPLYLYRLNMRAVALSIDRNHADQLRLELTYMDEKIEELMEYNLVNMSIQRFKRGQDEVDRTFFAQKDDEGLIDKLMEE